MQKPFHRGSFGGNHPLNPLNPLVDHLTNTQNTINPVSNIKSEEMKFPKFKVTEYPTQKEFNDGAHLIIKDSQSGYIFTSKGYIYEYFISPKSMDASLITILKREEYQSKYISYLNDLVFTSNFSEGYIFESQPNPKIYKLSQVKRGDFVPVINLSLNETVSPSLRTGRGLRLSKDGTILFVNLGLKMIIFFGIEAPKI